MHTPFSKLATLISLAAFACGGSQPAAEATLPEPPPAEAADPAPAPAPAEPTVELRGTPDDTLIPRDVLFGNPDRSGVQISPDGKHLSWRAPDEANVLNIFIAPVGDPGSARQVTRDKKRGVRMYFWAWDNRHILYLQDEGGDENWHVFATNIESGETRDLTPVAGVNAQVLGVSHKVPGAILVGLNDRNPQLHDVHRVELATGERSLVLKNEGYVGFIIDDDYNVRAASKPTPEGGFEVLKRVAARGKKGEATWETLFTIPQEDAMTTALNGLDARGRRLYVTDSRGRNTAALFSMDLGTGKTRLIAESERADVSGVMMHPIKRTVEAVAFTYEKREWQILDGSIKKDFEALKKVHPGQEFSVTDRTRDDRTWIVAFFSDDSPVRYYVYDRRQKKATFLFTNDKDLEGLELAKMHPVVIESRDGLNLVSYLTLPVASDPDADGRPSEPVPLVLNVHGGPWARDGWGLNPEHQWLANRGYAVLSVNYRGSTGFGKEFVNAANKEWGGKMHDDLIDAVNWAVAEGITRKDQVAIYGGSYGGYAALVGMTFTPDTFACGVDLVGVSNLETFINSIPPYWKPFLELLATRVGDPRTEEGKKFLASRSPLTHVDKIKKPLLIAQGANDPRVKKAESDQIVQAMQARGIPVTYLLYPDEGHGFARPENRLSFYAVAEAFLAQCFDGTYLPIGDDFQGSSIQVPTGANAVPGLAAALR